MADTKTLGQIAHEAGERAGRWERRWGHLSAHQKVEWEEIADTVAEHVLATRATPAPGAPGQEAAAVLSEQQIRHWWESENGLEDCDMCKIDDFRKVVRAVEEKLAGAGEKTS